MSGSALAVPRPRVLVVDPDADTRALYEQSFTAAGFDVAQAVDGRDALTKALVHPPSLVVMELRLPFIDGFALCDILKHDRATSRVPILVVTDETRPDELERIRGVGANDVLLKPVPVDFLAEGAGRLISASYEPDPYVNVVSSGTGFVTFRPWSPQTGRTAVAKRRRELTMHPPLAPPALTCPSCDHALTYQVSHTGGVSDRHPEQWDYFSCAVCGGFKYRHRTRKLRRLDASEQEWLQRRRAGGV